MSQHIGSGSVSSTITPVEIVLLGFELVARKGTNTSIAKKMMEASPPDICGDSRAIEFLKNISGEVKGYIKQANELGVFVVTGAGWNFLMAIKLKREFHAIPRRSTDS